PHRPRVLFFGASPRRPPSATLFPYTTLFRSDGQGVLGALKLLRDEGLYGDVPVILLGVPEGMEHRGDGPAFGADAVLARPVALRSEEHTSELQSRFDLVCRLLLEKKNEKPTP